jgi:hypothetical protein
VVRRVRWLAIQSVGVIAVILVSFQLSRNAGVSTAGLLLVIGGAWVAGRIRPSKLSEDYEHNPVTGRSDGSAVILREPRPLRVVGAFFGAPFIGFFVIVAVIAVSSGDYPTALLMLIGVVIFGGLFVVLPWRQRLVVDNTQIRFRSFRTTIVERSRVATVRLTKGSLGRDSIDLLSRDGLTLMSLPTMWVRDDVLRLLASGGPSLTHDRAQRA